MYIQNIAGVCLFAVLIIIVQVRAAMFRRRGIKVFVFGQTNKSDFLILPCVFAVIYTILAATFNLPIQASLINRFWGGTVLGFIGVCCCSAAVVMFALTLKSFGESFRVGIDKHKPDKLVTSGMFSISRNPIYVCFLLFFIGLLLIYSNVVVAVALILLVSFIHRQVLREEKFLVSHYGEEYINYCNSVRRYL